MERSISLHAQDYSMAVFATIDEAIMAGRPMRWDSRWRGSLSESKMAMYVFSHSQPPGKRGGVTFVTNPEKFRRKNSARLRKNVWLMGGGELGPRLPKERSVDELYIGIVPVLMAKASRFSQRFPATRIYPARKQDLLERPDRPQYGRARKTKAQKVGVGVRPALLPTSRGKSGEN